MGYPINIPNFGFPPVPGDTVHIEIVSDTTRCSGTNGQAAQALAALQANGIDVSISRLIAYSSIHFSGAIDDHAGLGLPRESVRRAWGLLSDWRPHAVERKGDGKPKLVFDDRRNPNTKRWITELVGVGVGLFVAKQIYDRPFRFWHSNGHGRMDYTSYRVNLPTVKVELRGRFNRTNIEAAKTQVLEKIAPQTSFDTAAGIIVYPRTTADTRTEDVFVMDPDGLGAIVDHYSELRALLLHYAPFFSAQGFLTFAARLQELASLPSDEFSTYLAHGDNTLKLLVQGRTTFRFFGREFFGTVWQDLDFPVTVRFESVNRIFFWGLDREVLDALVGGQLESIVLMGSADQTLVEQDLQAVVLDDATLLAWFPSTAHAVAHD